MPLPFELPESLKKGECILFVGAGLSEGLPKWEELAQALADELHIPVDKDLRKTASYYEIKCGRKKLEDKIVSELKKDVPLTQTHEILSTLPLKAIVTTNYDHLLERALSKKKRKWAKVIYGTEAPRIGADQLQLIKMHGDLDDPSTIVITKKDYDEYAEKHKALVTHLLGLLITCNVLFVGFSLEDPNFDNIYTQIKQLFGPEKRTGFAIFRNPPPYEVERLHSEMGIEVIPIADFDEVPQIFEELHDVCSLPYAQADLTPPERERIHDTFCAVVERQNRWLDPRGIFQFEKMLTRKDVELEDVYVVPRLVKQVRVRRGKRKEEEEAERGTRRKDKMEGLDISEDSRGEEEIEGEEYFFEEQIELTLNEALSNAENTHMVILGEPGVGKTCLLQYIALKTSTNPDALPGNPLLPILIPLREYTEFGNTKPLREFIFHYIRNRISSLPEPVLEDFMGRNSFFFLFDGLDEVVKESERMGISKQVEQFMAMYPHTRMILTSRPAGYRTASLIGTIPHFTLAEFNDNEIKEFLVKWFAFLEKVEAEKFEEAAAEKKADELARIIMERERILRLARNPLLLTIMVLIHRVGKKLPERRAEFYEYAVKTVAGTWERWKNLHPDRKIPDQDVIPSILEKIGFNLHCGKGENVVEAGELRRWLKEAMEEEMGHSSREEINDFIWMLRERAGLLAERGLDLYGFVHLTFQEYFAARYIALGRGTSSAADLIRKNLYSSRWREVFLLAAAVAPPQQADLILESVLNAKNDFEEYIHSNLIFAGEVLADQPRVSDPRRKDIIERLIGLTDSGTIGLLRIEAIRTLTVVRRVVQFEDRWALKLLRDEDSDVRGMAVEYFTKTGVGDPETRKRFFELLHDEDSYVRRLAVEYFTQTGAGDPETRKRIFELLHDEDSDVRWRAVEYFTQTGVGDPETRKRIFELLHDEDWNVRWRAVEYFTQTGAGDPEVKGRIFELLKDQSYSLTLGKTIQDAAIEYLSKYAPKESKEKAPNFFKSKDEFTRVGAYKLMKALLVSQ